MARRVLLVARRVHLGQRDDRCGPQFASTIDTRRRLLRGVDRHEVTRCRSTMVLPMPFSRLVRAAVGHDASKFFCAAFLHTIAALMQDRGP